MKEDGMVIWTEKVAEDRTHYLECTLYKRNYHRLTIEHFGTHYYVCVRCDKPDYEGRRVIGCFCAYDYVDDIYSIVKKYYSTKYNVFYRPKTSKPLSFELFIDFLFECYVDNDIKANNLDYLDALEDLEKSKEKKCDFLHQELYEKTHDLIKSVLEEPFKQEYKQKVKEAVKYHFDIQL